MHHKQTGYPREQGHGREVFVDVVAAVWVNKGVDRHQANVAHDNGVAIGRCAKGLLHGRHAAAAAFVVNDERHTQLFGEFSTNGARHNARGAARCKGDNPPHCFFGPVAGLTKRWQTCSRQTSSTHPLEVITTIHIFKCHNGSVQIFVSWNMPQKWHNKPALGRQKKTHHVATVGFD